MIVSVMDTLFNIKTPYEWWCDLKMGKDDGKLVQRMTIAVKSSI